MLGYPAHFGQMECIKLCSSHEYPEKRIGYLGLMVLFDERQEVLMMITNCMKNDLHSTNQYVVSLALCALGNIGTAEMGRDLASEVQKLLVDPNPYLRKKAAACSVRIARGAPEIIEGFLHNGPSLLKDRHHGVLLGALSLGMELCAHSDDALDTYKKSVPNLVKMLKLLTQHSFTSEHDVSGIADPFLQVKVLQFLRILGRGDAEVSDQMSDVLAQVASSCDVHKNAGIAVAYECVQTIVGLESLESLRVLAVNMLGRFLSHKDNNMRYVALDTLVGVINVDNEAVQRHRNTIVECLRDPDPSIRRRALELTSCLANEDNIRDLTEEILSYISEAEADLLPELTKRACHMAVRFSQNPRWQLETFLRILIEAGNYVRDTDSAAFIRLLSNAPWLQGFAARAAYRCVSDEEPNPALIKVCCWIVGEYGDMIITGEARLDNEPSLVASEDDVIARLEIFIRDSSIGIGPREYVATALMKLGIRFPQRAKRQATHLFLSHSLRYAFVLLFFFFFFLPLIPACICPTLFGCVFCTGCTVFCRDTRTRRQLSYSSARWSSRNSLTSTPI